MVSGNTLQSVWDYFGIIVQRYGETVQAIFGIQQANITVIGFITLMLVFILTSTILYAITTQSLEKLGLFDNTMRSKIASIISFSMSIFSTIVAPLSAVYVYLILLYFPVSVGLVVLVIVYYILSKGGADESKKKWSILISAIITIVLCSFVILQGSSPAPAGSSPIFSAIIMVAALAILFLVATKIPAVGWTVADTLNELKYTISKPTIDENELESRLDSIIKKLEDVEKQINKQT